MLLDAQNSSGRTLLAMCWTLGSKAKKHPRKDQRVLREWLGPLLESMSALKCLCLAISRRLHEALLFGHVLDLGSEAENRLHEASGADHPSDKVHVSGT